MSKFPAPLLMVLLLATPALAQSTPIAWTSYSDPAYDFSVELPLGLFEPLEQTTTPGMTLAEVGGTGELSIYGAESPGLTLDQFAQTLSSGEQVRTITYKAGGNSWFVLSGYYEPLTSGEPPVIFYTKVLLSPDGDSFSAFEISYPEADKARYDPIVDRIENSMTRPGNS